MINNRIRMVADCRINGNSYNGVPKGKVETKPMETNEEETIQKQEPQ